MPLSKKEKKREYDKIYIARNRVKRYAYSHEHYLKNKVSITARHKRYRDRLRADAIAHLGGKCAQCGYNENPLAFQIDHVNGGGNKDRSSVGGMYYMREIVRDTSGKYQLLCANCNQIKKIVNQEHGWNKKT